MADKYSIDQQKKVGARIAQARENIGMSQTELADRIELNRTVLNKIENGNRPARDLEIKNIANVLNISTDYLLGNSNKKHYYDLTEKDKKDVGLEVEEILNGMTGGINFYGEPMTDEDRERLKASLEMALELSKREAKKKFTPKKYRDG